ncbi:hypothetical protein EDC01DRAFT_62955 [Geopyxis carbonaria]|nr:hypothetical protein EDC01DRAFT_62955 [Geopyxis carbonaria]
MVFACAGTEAPADRAPMPIRSPPLGRSSSALSRSKSHLRSRSENESMSNFAGNLARGLSISSPSNPRTTLKMTPKNSPLKLITSFPSPEKPEPIQRSATTSPKIAGVNRFFYSSGASRSACATPIAMSALTPVDPFWQHDPFPSSARTMTPGTAKLPPVTESPRVSRLTAPIKDIKISSPIEPRTSSGFGESISPVTLGEASRGPSPGNLPPRKPSPPHEKAPYPGSPTGSPPSDPLPAPPASAFAREVSRAAVPRKPAAQGLQIQWPPIDTIIRDGSPAISVTETTKGHTRKGSITRPSPPVPSGRFAAPPKSPKDLDNLLALMEKGQKRLDSQRATHRPSQRRLRPESPDRGAPRRRAPRPRDLSLERGRPGPDATVKTAHMRSPSSPLPFSPQARMYHDDAVEPNVPEEPEPLSGRFYGDDVRGRGETRLPDANRFRSPSSPLPFTAQAAHYQGEADDRIDDDDGFDEAERFYTTAPAPRDTSRGRDRHAQPSHMRSPSSPLPLSPQAQLYTAMSAEVSHDRAPRAPRRRPSVASHRTGSISRAHNALSPPRAPFAGTGTLRRSRSERTMKQWSDQLERAGTLSGTSLARELSTRGLPSNPRAWRAELQAASRSNSPLPGTRGRSPHITPTVRGPTPSPARRIDGHRARSSSRSPAPAPAPAVQNPYYPSPVVAEYESIGSPLSTGLPELPQFPAALPFEPLIRKLPPQPPPDSPPPLPHDLPVHPALQMHLEPSLPGRKGGGRTGRRVKRAGEMGGDDGGSVYSGGASVYSGGNGHGGHGGSGHGGGYGGAGSIVVGIEPADAWPREYNAYYNPAASTPPTVGMAGTEMAQRKTHHKSASSASSGIGATNQI